MSTKQLLESKKLKILSILEDHTLNSEEKLKALEIESMLETLSIYETELHAQNDELLEKEKILNHSKEEFEILFEFAPIPYLELDSDFYLMHYNKRAIDLFESIGIFLRKHKQFSNYISQKDYMEFLDFLNVIQDQYQGDIKINIGTNNKIIPVHIYMKKVIFDNGIMRFYVAIIDLTKEKEHQDLLMNQAKNIAMGEMLSMITHQWKQPLSALLTFSTLLEYKVDTDTLEKKELQKTLLQMKDQIEYMNDTIHDFKHFFDEVQEKVILNVSDCINRAIKFTSAGIKKADIVLESNYIDNPNLKAFGFSNDVCQILMNIINNAKDELVYKNGERHISINISNSANNIVIKVRNNGGHIPEECMESIFNKNFTTKGHSDGSGLGLYMSQMIVKEHLNGSLRVENIEDDSVEFTLEIPIYEGIG